MGVSGKECGQTLATVPNRFMASDVGVLISGFGFQASRVLIFGFGVQAVDFGFRV